MAEVWFLEKDKGISVFPNNKCFVGLLSTVPEISVIALFVF